MEFQRGVWLFATIVLMATSVQGQVASKYSLTTVTLADGERTECGSVGTELCSMEFVATWSVPPTVSDFINPIEIDWFLESNTARAGEDFVDATLSLTKNPPLAFTTKHDGDNQASLFVTIRDDHIIEHSQETFFVYLTTTPDHSWGDVNFIGRCSGPEFKNGAPNPNFPETLGQKTGTACAATGTIVDDEDATIFIADAQGVEGVVAEFQFKVFLSHRPDATVYVDYYVPPHTDNPDQAHYATLGQDFVFPEEYRTLSLTKQTELNRTIKIAVNDDNIQENVETFEVKLRYPKSHRPTDGSLVGELDNDFRKLRVVSNPQLSTPRLSAVGKFQEEMEGAYVYVDHAPLLSGERGLAQEEGEGEFEFKVKLNKPVDTDVTLTMETLPGDLLDVTRNANTTDYTANAVGDYTFKRLATDLTYTVLTKNDDVQSAHADPAAAKAFRIKWTVKDNVWAGAGNGGKSFWNVYADEKSSTEHRLQGIVPTVQSGFAYGYIHDDEAATMQFSSQAFENTVSEADGSFKFTVDLSHKTDVDIPYLYNIADNTTLGISNRIHAVAYRKTGCLPCCNPQLHAQGGHFACAANLVNVACLKGCCPTNAAPGTCDLYWADGHNDAAPGAPGHRLLASKDMVRSFIDFGVIEDQVSEPVKEMFGLKLQFANSANPHKISMVDRDGVPLVDNVVMAWIEDNDELEYGLLPVNGVPQGTTVSEHDSYMFTVFVDKVVQNAFELELTLEDGSAKLGQDFKAIEMPSGGPAGADRIFFSFENGSYDCVKSCVGCTAAEIQAECIRKERVRAIPTINDEIAEADESFDLVISHVLEDLSTENHNNDILIKGNVHEKRTTILVTDNENLGVYLKYDSALSNTNRTGAEASKIYEGDDNIQFVATLTHDIDRQLQVDYRAVGNTAQATIDPNNPLDFSGEDNRGTLTFNPSNLSGTGIRPSAGFQLFIIDDILQEWDSVGTDANMESLDIVIDYQKAKSSPYFPHASPSQTWDASDNSTYGVTPGTLKWHHRIEVFDYEGVEMHVVPAHPEGTLPGVGYVEDQDGVVFHVELTHAVDAAVYYKWEVDASSPNTTARMSSAANTADGDFQYFNGPQSGVIDRVALVSEISIDLVDDNVVEHPVEKLEIRVFDVSPPLVVVNRADSLLFADQSASATPLYELRAVGEILDNDEAVFVVSQPAVYGASNPMTPVNSPEGTGTITFRISLESKTAQNTPFGGVEDALGAPASTTFTIQAADGTATQAKDFSVPAGEWTVTVPAGATYVDVPVTVTNDELHEAIETFKVNVTASAASVVKVRQGTTENILMVEIPDTEGATLRIESPPAQDESANNAMMNFTVALSHNVEGPISVFFDTMELSGGSATANGCLSPSKDCDFLSATKKAVTLGTNGQAVVSVPLIDDDVQEDVESFKVNVYAGPGSYISCRTALECGATGTLTDDEDAMVGVFLDPGMLYSEGLTSKAKLIFNVQLNKVVGKEVTVSYTTAADLTQSEDVRARPCGQNGFDGNCDYTPVSGTITFAAGAESTFERTRVVEVPVFDTAPEIQGLSKYLKLKLSALRVDGQLQSTEVTPHYQGWNGVLPTPTDWDASGMIIDDEGVQIIVSHESGLEPDEGVNRVLNFTVTLTKAVQDAVSFEVKTTDVTATAGQDYDAVTTRLEFSSYSALALANSAVTNLKQYVAVKLNPDAIVEYEETFTLSVSPESFLPDRWNNGGFSSGVQKSVIGTSNATGTGTIQQTAEPGARIDVVRPTVAGSEAEGTFVFRLAASHEFAFPVVLSMAWDQQASTADESDVVVETLSNLPVFTFPASTPPGQGNSIQEFSITVLNDNVTEADETIALSLSLSRPAVAGTSSRRLAVDDQLNMGEVTNSILIGNDDLATIEVTDVTAAETLGAPDFAFQVKLSHQVAADFEVSYTVDATSASANLETYMLADASDFAVSEGVLLFPAAFTALTPYKMHDTISVAVENDDVQEFNGEVFQVTLTGVSSQILSGPTDTRIALVKSVGVGTITDDEACKFIIANSEENEASSMKFIVSASHAISIDYEISWVSAEGTATKADVVVDLNGDMPQGTETIAKNADASARLFNIEVGLIDDFIQEEDEMFTVTLAASANNPAGFLVAFSDTAATGTINNDDEGVTLQMFDTEGEEGTEFTFTASLSHACSYDVQVPWHFAPITPDFSVVGSEELIFNAGVVNSTCTVKVANDDFLETTEIFTIVVDHPDDEWKITLAGEPAEGIISDHEDATIYFEDNNSFTAEEGSLAMEFEVTLSHRIRSSSPPLTVLWHTTEGSATGADFVTVDAGAGRLQFESHAGVTPQQTRVLKVDLLNDDIQETNAEMTASAETFTVTLDTWVPHADEDHLDGMDPGFLVSFPNPSAEGIITDEERVTLKVSDVEEEEGAKTALFTVTLSHSFDFANAGSTISLSVPYTTDDRTAIGAMVGQVPTEQASEALTASGTQPVDFMHKKGELEFKGFVDESVDISVTLYDDHVQEMDETFALVIEGDKINFAANMDLVGSKLEGTATFSDDNEAPSIAIYAPADAYEMDIVEQFAQKWPFQVTLSHAISTTVKVAYSVEAGSAVPLVDGSSGAHYDYEWDTENPSISFPTVSDGSTGDFVSVPIDIWINNDAVEEGNETFNVVLGDLTHSFGDDIITISTASATGTILEGSQSDEDVQITIADISNGVEGSTMVFSVSMTHEVDVDVTVAYTIVLGEETNADDVDISQPDGTITFTQFTKGPLEIPVEILSDDRVEGPETFQVRLISVTTAPGVEFGRNIEFSKSTATGTIIDTDEAVATVTCTPGQENSGVLRCPVALSNAVSTEVEIRYRTAWMTAETTENLHAKEKDIEKVDNGMITIPANTEEFFIEIILRPDNIQEMDESFEVILTGLDVAAEGFDGRVTLPSDEEDRTATAVILDDEGVKVSVQDRVDVTEGTDESATLTISMSHHVMGDVTVQYRISGDSTAEEGFTKDYVKAALDGSGFTVAEDGKFTFSAGEFSALDYNLHFEIQNDDLQELFEEYIEVEVYRLEISPTELSAPTKVAISKTNGKGRVVIADDETSWIKVTHSPTLEAAGAFYMFTLSTDVDFSPNLVLDYTTVAGSASAASDYTTVTSSVTFGKDHDKTQQIRVAVKNDDVAEKAETFTLQFTGEEDVFQRFKFTENDSPHEDPAFTATLLADNEGLVPMFTVNGRISSCTGGKELSSCTTREGEGATAYENGAPIPNANEVTVRVTLSKAIAEPMWVVVATSAGETNEERRRFTAKERLEDPLPTDDYLFGFAEKANFMTGDFVDLRVVVRNDQVHEDVETFGLHVLMMPPDMDISAYNLPVGWMRDFTITDNEDATLMIDVDDVKEGEELVFNIQLSHTAEKPATVSYIGSSSTYGDIQLNERNGFKTTLRDTFDRDFEVRPDEEVDVQFTLDEEATFKYAKDLECDTRVCTVTGIVMNQDSARVAISGLDTIEEGNVAKKVTFTLDTPVPSGFEIRARSTTGGSAVACVPGLTDCDYTPFAKTVKFDGRTDRQQLTIDTNNDNVVEGKETISTVFEIVSDIADNMLTWQDGSVSTTRDITVTDVNSATVTISSPSVDEGGVLEFTFMLSNKVDVPVDVFFQLDPDTAESSDYSLADNAVKVTFPAMSTAPRKVFVNTKQDDLVEADETFIVFSRVIMPGGLSNLVTRKVVFPPNGRNNLCDAAVGICVQGTIRNDDDAVISVSPRDATATPEGAQAKMVLKLSNPVDVPLTVSVSPTGRAAAGTLSDGVQCACAGAENCVEDLDCDDITIYVPAKSKEVNFQIATHDDDVVEALIERFNVILSQRYITIDEQYQRSADWITSHVKQRSAVLGSGSIQDNDSALVTVAAGSAMEDSGSVNMRVSLGRRVDQPIVVSYVVNAGTATENEDYAERRTYSVEIPAMQPSAMLTVQINDDEVVESDETFFVTLTRAQGAEDRSVKVAGENGGRAQGTIIDDEKADFSIQIVPTLGRNTPENIGVAEFTVRLSSPAAEPIAVRLQARDGSAILGTDYSAPDKEDFVIAAGEISERVTVAILDDGVDEVDEFFTLTATIQPRDPPGSLSSILASSKPQASRKVTIIDPAQAGNAPPVATPFCQGQNAVVHTTANKSPPLCFDLTPCFTDADDDSTLLRYEMTSTFGGAHITQSQKASITFKAICFTPTAETSYTVEVSANDGKSTSLQAITFQVKVGPETFPYGEWSNAVFKATPNKVGEINFDLPKKAKVNGVQTYWGLEEGDAGCTVSNVLGGDATCEIDADKYTATFSYGGDRAQKFTGSTEVCVAAYCFSVVFPASPSPEGPRLVSLMRGGEENIALSTVSGAGVYQTPKVESSDPSKATISVNGRTGALSVRGVSKGSGYFTIRVADRPEDPLGDPQCEEQNMRAMEPGTWRSPPDSPCYVGTVLLPFLVV